MGSGLNFRRSVISLPEKPPLLRRQVSDLNRMGKRDTEIPEYYKETNRLFAEITSLFKDKS
jgi:hypothetical protein